MKSKCGEQDLMNLDDFLNLSKHLLAKRIYSISKLELTETCENLIRDALIFRQLLFDLLYIDSISFYRKVLNTKQESPLDSIWFIANKTIQQYCEDLIMLARIRVYQVIYKYDDTIIDSANPKSQNDNIHNSEQDLNHKLNIDTSKIELKINAQPNQKLISLRDIMIDIASKIQDEQNKDQTNVIWILTNSQRRCEEIQEYLNSIFLKKDDHKLYMYTKLRDYFCSISERNRRQDSFKKYLIQKDKKSQQYQEYIKETILIENFANSLDNELEQHNQQKLNAIIQTDNVLSSILEQEYNEQQLNEQLQQQSQSLKRTRNQFQDVLIQDEEQYSQSQKILKFSQGSLEEEQEEIIQDNGDQDSNKLLNIKVLRNDQYDDTGKLIFNSNNIIKGCQVIVNCINQSSYRTKFLNEFKPRFIICFDPNYIFLREILVNQSISQQNNLLQDVCILMYQKTIESSIYMESIKKENICFEKIIKENAQLGKVEEDPTLRIKVIKNKREFNTRIGKGVEQICENRKPIIIIDKREFNSLLPSKLYHDGFQIIPMLLEKGDYILSNDIGVERKQVDTGDLVESLRSGRLDKQLANMQKVFKRNILLIEFQNAINFTIEYAAERKKINTGAAVVNSINNNNNNGDQKNKFNLPFLLAKIVTKYPYINILWSKGVDDTSRMFKSIKENRPEPDPTAFSRYQIDQEKNTKINQYLNESGKAEQLIDLVDEDQLFDTVKATDKINHTFDIDTKLSISQQ